MRKIDLNLGLLAMRTRRGRFAINSVEFVGVVIFVCCLFVVIFSVAKLPEASVSNAIFTKKIKKVSVDEELGLFGKMIIEMLPQDLAFTVFLPSHKAFFRDLRLNGSDSLVGDKFEDTHAILTRILGFSVVPRAISSSSVPVSEEIVHDSLSGFSLYMSRDVDGMVIVNRIRSQRVDLVKGKIVVHIMDGVVMDAEFEQSIQPDYTV